MRRALILTVVFGGFLAGVGCKQIAGRNDCTYDPNDAQLTVPSNPYPTIGSPISGAAPTATEKLPDIKGK